MTSKMTNDELADTPRTNALKIPSEALLMIGQKGVPEKVVKAILTLGDHARQLERELNALRLPRQREGAMLSDDRIMAWVRILKVADDGRAYKPDITPLDVEACIRGALKEQATLRTTPAERAAGQGSDGDICPDCHTDNSKFACPPGCHSRLP